MVRAKTAFTILSILIVVIPMTGLLLMYHDNLLGIVLPPETQSLVNGGQATAGMLPKLTSETFNPADKTVSFYFSFTNELDSQITVNMISAVIYSADDNHIISHVSLDQPLTIEPKQTVSIKVSGGITDAAIAYLRNYIETSASGNIHMVFKNLFVDAAGVQVHSDSSDAGWITLPKGVV
jgi:hypothetical protein